MRHGMDILSGKETCTDEVNPPEGGCSVGMTHRRAKLAGRTTVDAAARSPRCAVEVVTGIINQPTQQCFLVLAPRPVKQDGRREECQDGRREAWVVFSHVSGRPAAPCSIARPRRAGRTVPSCRVRMSPLAFQVAIDARCLLDEARDAPR